MSVSDTRDPKTTLLLTVRFNLQVVAWKPWRTLFFFALLLQLYLKVGFPETENDSILSLFSKPYAFFCFFVFLRTVNTLDNNQ